MYSLSLPTEHGVFLAGYSDQGLAELRFPGAELISIHSAPATIQEWHELTSTAVQAILYGNVRGKLPPLDLTPHTPFRRMVWEQLLKIPLGDTASYTQVAERIGKATATRAVGGACGANPIPLIIPCHRVLAAGKALGGFSGGLGWKRKLLAIEGIIVNVEKPASRALNPSNQKISDQFQTSILSGSRL